MTIIPYYLKGMNEYLLFKAIFVRWAFSTDPQDLLLNNEQLTDKLVDKPDQAWIARSENRTRDTMVCCVEY